MLSFTTFQTIIQLLRMIADISILWILLYYTIKIVRNNSRTAQIFKGIILILIIRAVANFFGFKTVDFIAGILVTWGFLAIIIIFQPEIRTILERLGKSSVFSRLSTLSGNERTKLVDELVSATMQLSHNKVGALITLEQGHSLSDFIKTGTPMNSLVTSDLLMTIFLPNTPLHDGAVIIQGDRIACASAYFPPTNALVPTRYGARHRAAIGISEITDSVTIVVSEKSGRVSIAEEGKLTPMTQVELKAYLDKIILHDEAEVHSAEGTPVIFGGEKSKTKTPRKKSEVLPTPEIIDETLTSPITEEPAEKVKIQSRSVKAKIDEGVTEKAIQDQPLSTQPDSVAIPEEQPVQESQAEPSQPEVDAPEPEVNPEPEQDLQAESEQPTQNTEAQPGEPLTDESKSEATPEPELQKQPQPEPKHLRKPSLMSRLFGRNEPKPKAESEKPTEAEKSDQSTQPANHHIKFEYSVSDESLLDDDVSDASSKGGEEQ